MAKRDLAIETRIEPLSELHRHVEIPSGFEAVTILEVLAGERSLELRERQRQRALRKDYDLIESPLTWLDRFDVSNWSLLGAYAGGSRVGGAVCAVDTPGFEMLEGRNDLLVLCDLRVSPDVKRQRVGSALFDAVLEVARSKGCREIRVETQNTNVPACRFYESRGCRLHSAKQNAYAALPDETRLIWSKAVYG